MGKIFDALEKADRNNTGAAASIEKTRKKRRGRTAPEKVVPLVKAKRAQGGSRMDPSLIAFHDPYSVEAEMFKVLRTNILFASEKQPPKTILVTSALPGDGKSFVSANLAISIAQGIEEHVLLIDGDIRKADIHQRFGYGQVTGLSDYLAKGDDIADSLLKTPIAKLTLLPAGRRPANPSELMSSKKMKALLEEVKKRYEDRYIIIDSPPPAMASETNAIAKYVDGVIVVVRAEKTPREAVADTIEQIGKEKLLGIVLNQANKGTTKYYGYGKTHYGKK